MEQVPRRCVRPDFQGQFDPYTSSAKSSNLLLVPQPDQDKRCGPFGWGRVHRSGVLGTVAVQRAGRLECVSRRGQIGLGVVPGYYLWVNREVVAYTKKLGEGEVEVVIRKPESVDARCVLVLVLVIVLVLVVVLVLVIVRVGWIASRI